MASSHERCDLPEGAIVNVEVGVVGYIHPDDGEMAWALRTNCDAPTSSVVGLLEMAKLDLIARAARD
jgi:hypothetical protein